VSTTSTGYGTGMDANGETRLELHEPGFDGDLVIENRAGARMVRLTGARPQDGAAVAKNVPADRDPELSELVELAVAGQDGIGPRLLAHLGVLDPT
jgi:hypothetical protein